MISRNSNFDTDNQFYSEEEILKNGLSVYEYDSIVEVKQLEPTDEIYKIFKESKQKSIETRMLNITKRNTTK
jgi:hypothetical protein